jgi:hypothetical protein
MRRRPKGCPRSRLQTPEHNPSARTTRGRGSHRLHEDNYWPSHSRAVNTFLLESTRSWAAKHSAPTGWQERFPVALLASLLLLQWADVVSGRFPRLLAVVCGNMGQRDNSAFPVPAPVPAPVLRLHEDLRICQHDLPSVLTTRQWSRRNVAL